MASTLMCSKGNGPKHKLSAFVLAAAALDKVPLQTSLRVPMSSCTSTQAAQFSALQRTQPYGRTLPKLHCSTLSGPAHCPMHTTCVRQRSCAQHSCRFTKRSQCRLHYFAALRTGVLCSAAKVRRTASCHVVSAHERHAWCKVLEHSASSKQVFPKCSPQLQQ